MFGMQDFQRLDSKLNQLQSKYNILTGIFTHKHEEWNEAFELIEEIHEAFKKVRYPTKAERDTAWQHFYALRNKCYEARNQSYSDRSKAHYKELMSMLGGLEYWALADLVLTLLTATILKMKKEEMIERGKDLNRAAKYFSSVKHEMTTEHKTEIHTRIIEIRESHDQFWNVYKDRQQELQKVREEQKAEYEERRQRRQMAKEKVEHNLEGNREKLAKAENALERFEATKSDLEDKIASAYSDSYRERHETWLSEIEQKIDSVNEQIERLKKWIAEDEDKLANWRE